MKSIKIALAGSAALLASTAHAHADFVFTPLTYFLFAGPLGALVGPGVIYAGLQVAAYAAVLGAQFALSQRNQPKIDPGQAKSTYQDSESSEINAIGRVRLGGLKAFGNTKGKHIYRLIWHSRGVLDGIEEYHVGGRQVVVDPSGVVSSPPWARTGGSYMYIWSKPGDGTETAWTQLRSAFPDLWTPAHRCRGVFQSLVRFETPDLGTEAGNEKFQQLYQGGAPDIEITARVTHVYDPRDPSQDPDNESTWLWTDNGILCAVHIMRRYPDLRSTDFDWTFIAAEADKADAIVLTLEGMEPRARCWGIWPSESKRNEVMQQVLDSIGAEVTLNDDGLIRIRLTGDAPTAEVDLPALHLDDLNWKAGPDAVERPNVCRIRYYSPERGYDMAEIDLEGIPWARIEDEVDRYGEKFFDVELPFCPSASQAQRIGRRLFLQARADSGTTNTNMVGQTTWGCYYVNIEDEDAEETMLCRIAPPRTNEQAGEVDIPFLIWPQALIDNPWNPPTMEAPPPDPAPEIQFESNVPTPAKPADAAVVQYDSGTWETRLKFSGVSGGGTPETNYRYFPGGTPTPWAAMTDYTFEGSYYGHVAQDTRSPQAEFRVRFSQSGEIGNWSPYLSEEPFAVDNSAPPAPFGITGNRNGSTGEITITAKTDALNAVKLEFWYRILVGGTPDPDWTKLGTKECRPGEIQFDGSGDTGSGPSIDTEYRVRAITTNGTAGPYGVLT